MSSAQRYSCLPASATHRQVTPRQLRPARERSLGSHAILRGFVAVFLAASDFFRDFTAVFFPLAAVLTGDGNSTLGCFAVRWWPWCSGRMRAASSVIRSSFSLRFRRSSSRYVGIVLVVMIPVWQNYLRPSCPILVTRTIYGPPPGVGGFEGIAEWIREVDLVSGDRYRCRFMPESRAIRKLTGEKPIYR